MTTSFNLSGAEDALRAGNKAALYQGILDTCTGMRNKLQMLITGQLKRAVSVFTDPNYPKKQLRIIQTVEDGRLITNYWMDDTNIWEYCARRREQFDKMKKHAALTGTEHLFREYFMSSWLLETYILLKYAIDLRGSEWADPQAPDFKRVNWIIDNDPFASRYKLTTYSESRGMTNPFDTIRIEMSGLDLSQLLNNNNKEQHHGTESTITQSQRTSNTDGTDSSNQVPHERSQ